MIRSVIGAKSPNTAIIRASSILRFIRWCSDRHADVENPFYEEMVWNYICWLQDNDASATSGASFLSACRYAHYVFGFSLESILESRRIQGATELMHQEKRFLKQAKVLTVENVKWIHEQVTNEEVADFDRALFGYLLVAIYGRCRHSDLAHVQELIIDADNETGFCEIKTSRHKTSKTAVQKTMLLPIVIPVIGVHGGVWIHDVKAAFEKVGLSFEGKTGGPLLRPPSRAAHKGLRKRGVTSSEITNLLLSSVVLKEECLPSTFVDLSASEPISVGESDSEVSSDESSSGSSSDEAAAPLNKISQMPTGARRPLRTRFFKHKSSGVVHYLDVVMDSCATKLLACGRPLSVNFLASHDSIGVCKLCKVQANKREL